MHDTLLPLFPLSVVLLPQNPLPLHIFEDRYKEMIGRVLREGGEFGVVLAAGQGILPAGCTATVQEVTKEYPDGRLDIVTIGRRRFTIRAVDQELAYARGEVEFFEDDEPGAPAALREQAAAACRPILEEGLDLDDPQLSFLLAQPITDSLFRQQMLMLRSERERLERLITFLPGYLAAQKQAAARREAAGKNGHGKLPPGLVH
ncbi:MAG: LON peptidase substrate-binding domain-containing protein [Bryobacterales bacterium]|nr:LON peptidase substrate-binding domain-containing protein [Bryobacterales bacterium]